MRRKFWRDYISSLVHSRQEEMSQLPILASEGEAIFFDSFYYPIETLRMIEIAETEELDPIALVNTHWHVDHTAGNDHFAMHIVSQEKCVELMRTELPAQLDKAKEKIGTVQVKYPDWTFEHKLKLTVGDKEVTFLHLPGHTPDSIVGLVEKDHLLIAGDTVMLLPFVAYGSSKDLLQSLTAIKAMDVKTIIQGHGGQCDKSKLDADMKYVEKAQRIVGEALGAGKSIEQVRDFPIENFLPEEGLGRLSSLYKGRIHKSNLERIYRELAGAKI